MDDWERALEAGVLPRGLRHTEHETGTWWADAVQRHGGCSGTWAWPGSHGVDFVCPDCDEVHTVSARVVTASGWVTSPREWLDWLRGNLQGWGWLRVTEDRAGTVTLGSLRRVSAPLTEGYTRLCVVQGDWIAAVQRHADHIGEVSGFFSERLNVFPDQAGEIHPHVGFRCRRCNVDDRLSFAALEADYSIWFGNDTFAHLLPAIVTYGAGLLDTFTLRQTERAHIEEWQRQRIQRAMREPPAPIPVDADGNILPFTPPPTGFTDRQLVGFSQQVIYQRARAMASDAEDAAGFAAAYVSTSRVTTAQAPVTLEGIRSTIEDLRGMHGIGTEPVAPMTGEGAWVNVPTVPIEPPKVRPAWARIASRAKRGT